MSDSSGEKTEAPTPQRLKELRKKGTVARSVDLPMAVSLVALVVALPAAMGTLTATMRADLATSLSAAGTADLGYALRIASRTIGDGARALAPVVAWVAFASIVASVAVTRSKPTMRGLRGQWELLNPKMGIKRLVSPHSLVELLKAAAKLALVGIAAYGAWQAGVEELQNGPRSVDSLTRVVSAALHSMLVRIALLGMLVGAADAWWSRRRYGKQAKMSKEDLRQEAKTTEGNPHVKGEIKARQRAMSRNRMIAAVAQADVVLANPTHIAVALSYSAGTSAPVVVAKGAGVVAQKIKDKAAEHGVPVMENRPLARALWKATDVGDVIPAELFRAVAEVLALVFATRRPRAGTGRSA